jgi:isopenicillin-N N-acyltransferase like protein
VRVNVALYDGLIPGLSSHGAAVRARMPADLVAEVEGIAAGAGVDLDSLSAMQARTELLAGAECSVIGRPGRVEQTWDWYREIVPLVWVVEHGDGWFCTLTEAGMLGKIGISSAGLCVGLNLLRCSLDGGLGEMPVHVLLRVLLDRIDSFEHAVARLRTVHMSASSCVTVASAGEVAAVELSPGGARVLRGDPLLHTNHFLDGPPVGEDLEIAEGGSTLSRLEALSRGEPLSAVCQNEPDATTLATVVIEPGVPRMVVNGEEIVLP